MPGQTLKWRRVTREFKCPVCQKPDWCTVSERWVCCMRVQSARPAKNAMGGWLHPLGEAPKPLPPPCREPTRINSTALMRKWEAATKPVWVDRLARALKVSSESLTALCVAWAAPYAAWAFPMCDGYGNYVGVRLRAENGRKWAVPGSHQGIFLPQLHAQNEVYICEGPTDTAAALTLGLFAIGRPSCSGALNEIRTACHRLCVGRVVLVSDNDAPGINGAQKLADELRLPACVLVLPAKDMRAFVNLGGTPTILKSLLQNMVWNNPERTL